MERTNSEYSEQEIRSTIEEILQLIKNNVSGKWTKVKLNSAEIFQFMCDLKGLFDMYAEINSKECGRLAINEYIRLINLLIKIDSSKERSIEYHDHLENAYRIAARVSLEHFIIYYEWYEDDKLLEPRYEILAGYCYYLNKMCFDRSFEGLLANLPSGYGKCIDENSKILTSDGYELAKDVKVGDKVYSMNDNRECEEQKIVAVDRTMKPQVKITLRDNETIIISPEHRMLTQRGYVQAKNLRKTDYLYELRGKIDGKGRINDDELMFVACMIFEGYCRRSKQSYTGENNLITKAFLDSCKRLGITWNKTTKKGNKASSYALHNENAVELLEKYGLLNHLAYDKRLPKEIFTLSLKQKYDFIGIMLATDGYFEQKNRDCGIALANKELIQDIKLLLQSCGIQCKMHYKPNSCRGAWGLTVHGKYLKEIYENCNLYHKAEQCEKILDKLSKLKGIKSNVTNYPKQLFKGYRKVKGREDRPNCKPDYIYNCVSEEYFKELIKIYPELKEIEYHDFVYTKIRDIEKNDELIPMVDFEVENTHNFLLNGFVSHNSRMVRYYEAFRLGIEPSGTFLALCSNDDVIKGQSNSVREIMKNERYGKVFPHLRYDKSDKDYFLKETDGEWKLRQCKMIASYYAASTRTNVVGVRASLSVDIDDLYADEKEAQDENLTRTYYNKFVMVWRKRYVQNLTPQVIITGTMWSATDFLTKVINLWEKESEFIPDPKFKFCRVSKDGKRVIIQVPALDYETDESTCPRIKSTEELRKERETMDRYLWETNFQQRPTPPEGMVFDYSKLKTYEGLPQELSEVSYAVVDPNRKGKDYLSMPICRRDAAGDYYLTDILFEQTSTKYLINSICDKIILNKVVLVAIESNTDSALAETIKNRLQELGYNGCVVTDFYSTEVKEVRINNMKDLIKDKIHFPAKNTYGMNTPMGKAMEQLQIYSFLYPNRHDDMPDSLAMFGMQIILEEGKPKRATAVKRMF